MLMRPVTEEDCARFVECPPRRRPTNDLGHAGFVVEMYLSEGADSALLYAPIIGARFFELPPRDAGRAVRL
jgi:hypothetical protein